MSASAAEISVPSDARASDQTTAEIIDTKRQKGKVGSSRRCFLSPTETPPRTILTLISR